MERYYSPLPTLAAILRIDLSPLPIFKPKHIPTQVSVTASVYRSLVSIRGSAPGDAGKVKSSLTFKRTV